MSELADAKRINEMRVKLLKKELIMPMDQSFFRACHCSTFVIADNGDYLVTFFAGEREGTADNAIWMSRCVGGKKWVEPVIIQHDGTPHWNPVIFKNGHRLFVYFKLGPGVHDWISYYIYSDDNGYTWSERRLLCPEDPYSRGPVRNKIIRGRDGALLCPASVETDTEFNCFVERSTDNGATWTKCPIPIVHHELSPIDRDNVWEGLLSKELWENDLEKIERWDGVIQPSLWLGEGSNVHAFMRSTRGFIYRSDSTDSGVTWCEAYPTALPNNNSGLDVDRMDDGTLVLVSNPISGNWARRTPISISFSTDNGESFSEPLPLETIEGELSYPSVNACGKLIRITFTVKRRSFMYCECVIE